MSKKLFGTTVSRICLLRIVESNHFIYIQNNTVEYSKQKEINGMHDLLLVNRSTADYCSAVTKADRFVIDVAPKSMLNTVVSRLSSNLIVYLLKVEF